MFHDLWLSTVWDFDPTWSFRQVNHFSKFLDLVQHFNWGKKKDLDVFTIGSLEIARFRVEDKSFPINDVIPMANQILSDFIWAIPGSQ